MEYKKTIKKISTNTNKQKVWFSMSHRDTWYRFQEIPPFMCCGDDYQEHMCFSDNYHECMCCIDNYHECMW